MFDYRNEHTLYARLYSKQTKMSFYRITRSYDEAQEFCHWLTDKCLQMIVYQHDADEQVSRTHIHIYVVGVNVTTQSIRNKLKQCFEGIFRSDFKLECQKEYDDKVITYMSKGCLQPSLIKGFSQELIQTRTAEWQEPERKPLVQYKIKTESPAEAKLRQNELIDCMFKRIQETDCSVLDAVLFVLKDQRVITSRYKIRDYVDTMCLRRDKKPWRDRLEEFLAFRT